MRPEKEFWEWCGWTYHPNWKVCWQSPKKYNSEKPPPMTLDNLFKHAVPKLYESGYYYELIQWNEGQHKAIIKKVTHGWAVIASDVVDKDPAQAFYIAILEVIP